MKCWRMSAAAPTDNTCVVGDVRGIMPFTHAAKYQGRIAAEAIFGRPARPLTTGYRASCSPDPDIAAAGLTARHGGSPGGGIRGPRR